MFEKTKIKELTKKAAVIISAVTLLTIPASVSASESDEINCCGHNYHDWSVESTDGNTDHMVCYQCMKKGVRKHQHAWKEQGFKDGHTISICEKCGNVETQLIKEVDDSVFQELETPDIDALIRHKEHLNSFMSAYEKFNDTNSYIGKINALSEFIGVEPRQLVKEKVALEEKIAVLSDYLGK